jgi:hypothetical protein
MFEGELSEAPIAVVRVHGRQVPPGRAQLAIAVLDELRITIDAGNEADAELRSGAEKVEFLELDARGVLAALAAEGNAGIEGPDVLRRHFEVDDAVVKRHRPDLRIAQVPCVAQDARRLFEQGGLVEVATLEQQLIFDGPLARRDMQAIREARDRRVLIRRFGIEQVARIETDLADAGFLLLQLGIRWQAGDARRLDLRGAGLDAGKDFCLGKRTRTEADQGDP